MKKPKHKILYGAGMLAMALSLTACDKNEAVDGPPIETKQERPERNKEVYGPPPETKQKRPENNGRVYGPPRDTTEEEPDADDGAAPAETPDAGNSQTTGE